MSEMVIATKYRLPILDGKPQKGSREFPQQNHKDVPVEKQMVETVNANSGDNGIMWVIDEKKTKAFHEDRAAKIIRKREIKAQKAAAKKGTLDAVAEVVMQAADKKKKAEKVDPTPAKKVEAPAKDAKK